MKKIFYFFAFFCSFTSWGLAQDQPNTHSGPHHHRGGFKTDSSGQKGKSAFEAITPEQRAEGRASKLAQQLTLSADQKAKVKALYLQQEKEMKALFEKQEQDVKAVLTPEQIVKFDKINNYPHGGGKPGPHGGPGQRGPGNKKPSAGSGKK